MKKVLVTRVMKNAERHEIYKLAGAAKLAVPVAAQVSFDYKAWGEAHPAATELELQAQAQALIDAAKTTPDPSLETATTWSKGPLLVKKGTRAIAFPARPRGWEDAFKLLAGLVEDASIGVKR
jgi:hypothetical protein